ncbi:DevR family CRISPR-associated autoregulator [Desulfobacca acetoxidans]|uniref:CRISPR-associated autoregulator, DevR family n=1 Tax=Desulfobacca acetoxidans (strain ATCC 700848 / DSM 11109 / ASRB2) TaxID=880072 RepID=F2NJ29_DESAR|nr:DevR family CRISPR-associated autoregulator [Desulfobacca acetoxidans]AEB07987.1 CRISPR-associated autoregulator, DevR family [Desulfobacca acetoxidans DSM 11109]
MAGYLAVAAKLVLNVHDLNNEGSVGQALDIRQIRMVDENGNPLEEMPAVSGRMMKHWHLEHMRRKALGSSNVKLCSVCESGQPDRQTQATDELQAIEECLVCDVHGFLSTKKMTNAPRRSSCASFSWLLPALGTRPESKQVIHSRVASGTEASSSTGETSQMIFYKTYASGVFAFVAGIDLNRIGSTIDNRKVNGDIKTRRRVAIQALLPIVLGAFGASQSHALPHAKCLGLLAALSTTEKPVPNLISPIYSTGFEESIALLETMGNGVDWWSYGDGLKNAKKTVQEVFQEILAKI